MLDRTAEDQTREQAEAGRQAAESPRAGEKRDGALRRAWRSAWGFFVSQSFSSLTRRIVFLNLTGLIALLAGVLYLSQFRAGLIDARVQSLLVQSEIIAGAIAASATVETDSITIDPDLSTEHPVKPSRSSVKPAEQLPATENVEPTPKPLNLPCPPDAGLHVAVDQFMMELALHEF